MELLAISSSIEPMGAHFFIGILGQMWLWISVLSQAVRAIPQEAPSPSQRLSATNTTLSDNAMKRRSGGLSPFIPLNSLVLWPV